MLISIPTHNDQVKSIRCLASHLCTTPSLRLITDKRVRNVMHVCKAHYSGKQIGLPEHGSFTR